MSDGIRRYNPEREVTPEFLTIVEKWIAASGEVFVMMRYLSSAGSKDYAFIRTPEAFRRLIELCGVGTDIIVFRDQQLPLRGTVDEDFIRQAKTLFPDGAEYMFVRQSPRTPGFPHLDGEMGDSHADLVEDLRDQFGELVAVGPCPSFHVADNEAMISRSKGGIDGPR